MVRDRSDVFVVVVLTLTWLATVPLGLYFFTRVVGWPVDLAILVFLPFVVIWAPLSYPLAVSHNRIYRLGNGIGLSSGAVFQFGMLGILTAAMTAAAAFLHVFFRSGAWLGVMVVGIVAVFAVRAVVRVSRSLLRASALEETATPPRSA